MVWCVEVESVAVAKVARTECFYALTNELFRGVPPG